MTLAGSVVKHWDYPYPPGTFRGSGRKPSPDWTHTKKRKTKKHRLKHLRNRARTWVFLHSLEGLGKPRLETMLILKP